LGGIDQWVMIRGESLTNPPLIHLHGGPGFSETRLFRHFNAPLEKGFTVVYWDQRGAGKCRRDHWVPPETSVMYFDALNAPLKRLVWFEESGHQPFVDEPAKFNRMMVELVRPVAAP